MRDRYTEINDAVKAFMVSSFQRDVNSFLPTETILNAVRRNVSEVKDLSDRQLLFAIKAVSTLLHANGMKNLYGKSYSGYYGIKLRG